MAMLLIRPAQPSPVVHVPLLPEPQHDCPIAPQLPHWFPAVATTQPRSVMQALVAPASAAMPPPIVGQHGCPAPPQAPHMPGMAMLLIRPVQAIPALQDMATRIAAALPGLRGPFCFQAKRDVSGAFYVFEINARFGGGFPLAHRAGGQFSRWLIEAHFGLPSTETSNWQAGWTFLRYDQAVYFQS